MAESPVNGVGTTLASACLSTDTTFSLTSATGFTNAQYHCLISDGTNYEIVLATALSSTTLTVTRAVEAYNGVTTAFAFASGSTINVVPTVASVVGLIEGQPYLTTTGVGNATTATRYVGGTTNGAPTSGTFAVGDFIIDLTGTIWVCTTAGTPGTWTTTISSHLSLRSASATVGRNEITIFSGSTASQTLTAPSNPIDGSNWTVINKASVAITLSFTPSMIALGSSSGVTTFSVPANGSFSFVNYSGSQWYMVASNSTDQLTSTGAANQFLVTTGNALSYRYTQAQALGFSPSGIGGSVAETIPRMFVTTSETASSGTFRTTAVYLYAGQVISNITFATYTTAGATVTGTWGGLFTPNASYSTFTLVAATAQQSVSSLAASSYFTWPIATIASGASSTYTVPTTGIYYIGVCITATTMPNLTGFSMTPASNGSAAPPLQAATLTGSTNPASIGTTYTVSTSTQVIYYALT